MRILAALVRHETNTFSPLATPLSAFCRGTGPDGPAYGVAALAAYRGTDSALAAYIDVAHARGDDIEVAIAANAVPSGVVRPDAFDSICQSIIRGVQKGCDAVLLDLHGAMVVDGFPSAEGELLRRIRTVAPKVPIAVALDFHANISETMALAANVLTGYRTYPHVDVYETGERAARTLMESIDGKAEPVVLWRRLPMLTHMLRQSPTEQPMKDIMERAIQAESRGEVLNASIFGGFPLADVGHAGFSVVLVANARQRIQAESLMRELTQMAWSRRADFVFNSEPLQRSIAHAKGLREGPVVLVDHGDNCGAGGATDDMTVLAEVMRQGLDDVVAGPFCDPGAVELMTRAGVGSQVSLDVGGKVDIPAMGLKGRPLKLTGRVRVITDGIYDVTGPMYTGVKLSLGRTVVLETDSASILVCEKPQEPFDVGVFTHAGIDPARRRYVLIKSRQHFRAGFGPIARHVVLIAGPGVCSSDYSLFPFRNLERPMYPLDADVTIDA